MDQPARLSPPLTLSASLECQGGGSMGGRGAPGAVDVEAAAAASPEVIVEVGGGKWGRVLTPEFALSSLLVLLAPLAAVGLPEAEGLWPSWWRGSCWRMPDSWA